MRSLLIWMLALGALLVWTACSTAADPTEPPPASEEQTEEPAPSVAPSRSSADQPAQTQAEQQEPQAQQAQIVRQPQAATQQEQAQQQSNGESAAAVPPPSTDESAWIEQLSAGGFHNCVRWSDGAIECWGANNAGQLNVPQGVYQQLDAGYEHNCAIYLSGTEQTAVCWGANSYGESDAPPGWWGKISAGRDHSCADSAVEDGGLVCWGRNHTGQLDVVGGSSYYSVSAGSAHTCLNGHHVKAGWAIWCVGYNEYGQSGPVFAVADLARDADPWQVEVSAGAGHSCLSSPDGRIICWGRNEHGQANVPAGRFTSVSAGGLHTCALRTDASVACWGDNSSGQSTPPPGSFSAVSAGWYHSCAMTADTGGGVVCWGNNDSGQSDVPQWIVQPRGLRPVVAQPDTASPISYQEVRSLGVGGAHTCVTTMSDDLHCWGIDHGGETFTPAGDWHRVDLGAGYTCAFPPAGGPTCWGAANAQPAWNEQGVWIPYWGYRIGRDHRCRRHADDQGDEFRIVCFGDNTWYQAESPGGFYDRVNVGGDHNCARTLDGRLACWGRNDFGQAEAPDGRYLDVAAGAAHSCAIRRDGSLVCWGDNARGQLLAPSGTDYTTLITNSSADHTCALTSAREVVCWGFPPGSPLEPPPEFGRRGDG